MSELNHTGSQEESRLRGFHPFLLCVFDFVLLNVSFYALNYWKRGVFDLSSKYFRVLIAYGCYGKEMIDMESILCSK